MGVILGVVVIAISLALVALMMWSEWSQAPQAQPLAEVPVPVANVTARKSTSGAPKKKAIAAKKAPVAKKSAAKKKKK